MAAAADQGARVVGDEAGRVKHEVLGIPDQRKHRGRTAKPVAGRVKEPGTQQRVYRLAKHNEPLDVRWSRPMPPGVTPVKLTVVRDRAGRYFLHALVEEHSNRGKARERIAKLHASLSDARKDGLDQLTTRLVRENQVLVVEDLAVAQLTRASSGGTRREPGSVAGEGDEGNKREPLCPEVKNALLWPDSPAGGEVGRVRVLTERAWPR
ncbi:transposase [Streptomyces sp. H27-G5]|uniref:transposase n=1 Tax=Streptomyces sp. H27-G5 TaxID=2996698 RepID=UPI00226D4AB9|nr:transposase [Streptomyces sp. H27-G5]MCY0921926.1 transposase [Streptomyces sp. H27-G5]